MNARIDKEWVRCGRCGHKLGRMVGKWPAIHSMPALEIKCHSCREVNYIMIGGRDNESSDAGLSK